MVFATPLQECWHFNPRPPRGERPDAFNLSRTEWIISIHAPREGSDQSVSGSSTSLCRFQSTPPARGATLQTGVLSDGSRDFNPRPPRGERPVAQVNVGRLCGISIHAPREGSDLSRLCKRALPAYFNPRPPRGERPVYWFFRSTMSNFNPRPPRGERRERGAPCSGGWNISIHAPREGSDHKLRHISPLGVNFNPRPPRGERRLFMLSLQQPAYFNPRPPRGERRIQGVYMLRGLNFNPRPPRGERRPEALMGVQLADISIHAPREGSDAYGACFSTATNTFQSTPPARGATKAYPLIIRGLAYFNPRPPRGERL